jgi:hypothetical protein
VKRSPGGVHLTASPPTQAETVLVTSFFSSEAIRGRSGGQIWKDE